ncbi:MAG: YcxB family protein [Clostridia bacterium]|nr:YcxB family protein [Clostridia bacterium]
MIKCVVSYNKEVNEDLHKFNVLSNPWRLAIYIGATLISILLVILNRDSDFFAISVAILISVVCLDLVFVYSYFISPKLSMRNMREADIVKSIIEFQDAFINITSEYKGKKTTDKLYYQQIYRAYEGKNAFYLFVDKYNTLVVTKKGLVVGTENELKSLLNDKIKSKKRNRLK